MKNCKRIMAGICSLILICLIVFEKAFCNASTMVKFEASTMNLCVKKTSKIIIRNKNRKAHYTYKSSDTSIATVSKSGVVKGVSEGMTSVTVSSILKDKINFVGTVKITVKAEEKETVTPTAIPTAAPTRGTLSQKDEFAKKALVSTGNNYRIKNVIEKAKRGETVTIAYIGGSWTDGALSTSTSLSFAYRSYDYFKKTFGKGDGSNVKFVNAGLSGTPSTLGMIRYDKDVIQVAGCKPDIVFVEFAVNDGGDPTNGEGFECLIRNILKSENNPAVVLLFSLFASGFSEQPRLQQIGQYYNLAMVSFRDGVQSLLKERILETDEVYASDGMHPNDYGHELYAESIIHMYDMIAKQEKAVNDITIPETPIIGKAFEGIHMIDSKTSSSDYTISSGSFSKIDSNVYTSYHDGTRKSFPNNWMHTKSSGTESMKITITCKTFVIVYKACTKEVASKINVYVDGTKKATVDASDINAWNQPLNRVIFKTSETSKHEIEIKMSEDSLSKDFTIEAFGYTK